MKLFDEQFGVSFYPFTLAARTKGARHRIGGSAPKRIAPRHAYPTTRYLGTLGLTEKTDVSVFTSFAYETPGTPLYFFAASHRIYEMTNPLVQFVVHDLSADDETEGGIESGLPACMLSFSESQIDPDITNMQPPDTDMVFARHKAGGMPYFEQPDLPVVEAAIRTLKMGFTHMLQLTCPGKDDQSIASSWPFAEYAFHIFGRESNGTWTFRYGWA